MNAQSHQSLKETFEFAINCISYSRRVLARSSRHSAQFKQHVTQGLIERGWSVIEMPDRKATIQALVFAAEEGGQTVICPFQFSGDPYFSEIVTMLEAA